MSSRRRRAERTIPLWVKTLAVVGGLAVTGTVLTLFSSIGRRARKLQPVEVPPVGDPDFLLSVAGAAGAPIRTGGTVELLNNGDEFFPVMLDAFRKAERTINFAAYIWEPGRTSDEMFEAMTAAAQRGVQVRLLLDGIGGLRAPGSDLQRLKDAGGKVEPFRPPHFGKLTRFHKRNHRRAIVVDGRTAFTGGAAVGDKWRGNARNPAEWRDIMVKLTGPPAQSIQSAFVALWAPVAGEILSGPDYFPDIPNDVSGPQHIGIASSPSSEDHPLRLLFHQTFCGARKRLWITTPYFVPDLRMRQVVAERARAGVDVRILLPNDNTDAKPIRQTSHHYFQPLLEAGVRIYEYQPTMLHTKSIVVDGLWTVVGSANMDIRSHELNQENVIGILDAGLGRQMEETFLRDLADSKEIRLDLWRGRGAFKQAQERVSALLAEQY